MTIIFPNLMQKVMRPIISDLIKIEQTSRQEKVENQRFQEFLKKLKPEKVDEIVDILLHQILPKIDCTSCANCCKQLYVSITVDDLEKYLDHLKIPVYQFIDQYLTEDADSSQYVFKALPCPFLKDNLCREYVVRPQTCRLYPYLDRKYFSARLQLIFRNHEICPIVFNIIENLKDETGFENQLHQITDNENA